MAAYRAYRAMPYDAPAVAMAAALYAVRPQENYFKLSDPGTVTVGDNGAIRLDPAPAGKHRTLIADLCAERSNPADLRRNRQHQTRRPCPALPPAAEEAIKNLRRSPSFLH